MSRPQPDEFFPVPWYPQENRPEPIDIEEAATSLFLSNGAIPPPPNASASLPPD